MRNYIYYKDCLHLEKVDKNYYVSKTDINPATGKQYAINPSTGNWDDNYFANNEGSFNSGGGNSSSGGYGGGNQVDQLLNQVIDQYNKQTSQYQQKYNDYTKNNPFVFDKVLADETTKAQGRLDPYYQQTLGDFLQGVSIKSSRSLEDERNLLTELQGEQGQYAEQQRGQAGTNVENTGNQFQGAGLADSGLRLRAQGNNVNDANANIAQYTIPNEYQQQQARLATGRLVNTDLPIATSIEKRNLNQEESYNSQAQAQTAANLDYNKYQYALNQYTGAPPGVSPLSFQSGSSNILTGATG